VLGGEIDSRGTNLLTISSHRTEKCGSPPNIRRTRTEEKKKGIDTSSVWKRTSRPIAHAKGPSRQTNGCGRQVARYTVLQGKCSHQKNGS